MKKIFYLLLPASLAISSCKKDFLDVNTDPNFAQDATVNTLLPATIGYTAYSLGNQYQILGGIWAQYWTQGPTASQYESQDEYQINSTTYNRPWEALYSGPLTDLDLIISKATTENQPNYVAVAKIWKAFIFQNLTDLYGDIPFSQANKAEQGILNPNYDSQQQVYDGLITLINEGLESVDLESDIHPGADDLIYAGDMEKWVAFANTLKLRIYLRQVYVRPQVAEAGIRALYAEEASFITEEEHAEMKFFNVQFNRNPLYASINFLGNGNLIASNTSINYFRDSGDPRLSVFFDPASNGNYVGINQGEGKLLPNPSTLASANYSKPSPYVGGTRANEPAAGTTAPVIFISAAESYFLQSEAVLRGLGTGNVASLYNDGLNASFTYWREELIESLEVEGTDLDSIQDSFFADSVVVFPASGTTEDKLKAIITQKWVAMTETQSSEAWTEFRRTGYPDFLIVSLNSKIGKRFPARLFYPDSEQTRNPNTPPQKEVFETMWWDVK